MDDIHEVRLAVARMEGKLDGVLALAADHESRIRQLERAIWRAAGATGTIGAVLGAGIASLLGIHTG
jgi:hypothetical protein